MPTEGNKTEIRMLYKEYLDWKRLRNINRSKMNTTTSKILRAKYKQEYKRCKISMNRIESKILKIINTIKESAKAANENGKPFFR